MNGSIVLQDVPVVVVVGEDTTETRQCRKCGKIKSVSGFYGGCRVCKQCRLEESREAYRAVALQRNSAANERFKKKTGFSMQDALCEKLKTCPGCGIEKPLVAFEKPKSKLCKKCKEIGFEQLDAVATEIESWVQIDSVVRALAELQAVTNIEMQECEKRVLKIRECSEDVLEPVVLHRTAMMRMVESFLKKNCKGSVNRKYRFGSIHYKDGKCSFKLDFEKAMTLKDKP